MGGTATGLALALLVGATGGCGVVTKYSSLEGDWWALRSDEARLVEAPLSAPDDLATLDDEFDDPATLQVGLTAYTDYDTAKWYLLFNRVTAYHRDATKIANDGIPDLVADFEYIHFRRPR